MNGKENCRKRKQYRRSFSKEDVDELLEGYDVKRVGADSLKDDSRSVTREIAELWLSKERFLTDGLSYYLEDQGKIIGHCLSAFASDRDLEIGIGIDDDYRRKGPEQWSAFGPSGMRSLPRCPGR